MKSARDDDSYDDDREQRNSKADGCQTRNFKNGEEDIGDDKEVVESDCNLMR